jgi:hypothetical protein
MSNIYTNNLNKELDVSAMTEVRGGIWDYSNRLGIVPFDQSDSR